MNHARLPIGRSAAAIALRDQILRFAAYDEPVLVVGETGAGKELVARCLHDASARRGKPLQVIHCAGLGTDLLAAELFGHRRGAFTGADADRSGRILAAQDSTIVLDEITETAPEFQAAVLRVIEEGEIQPVGVDRPVRVNVRVVATSNRPLGEIAAGQGFREDLFHRLAAFLVHVPPLRDRIEDVAELAGHFLAEISGRYGGPHRLCSGALRLLEEHSFPGNVRELRQILLRAHAACRGGDELDGRAIAAAILTPARLPDAAAAAPADADLASLEEAIRRHIRRAVAIADGNLSEAARMLDVPRSTLQHYLVKYGVETRSRRADSAAR